MVTDIRKQKTKERLEKALVTLLQQHPFTDITTIQLTEEAGISRSSFYTHYKDKYEMIDVYQNSLFHKIEYIFEKSTNDAPATFLELFEFLNRETLLAGLLSENGTSEIQQFLRHKLKQLIMKNHYYQSRHPEFSKTELEYWSVYLSHAFFGVCQMWIARKKKESPQEITDFLMKILTTTPAS